MLTECYSHYYDEDDEDSPSMEEFVEANAEDKQLEVYLKRSAYTDLPGLVFEAEMPGTVKHDQGQSPERPGGEAEEEKAEEEEETRKRAAEDVADERKTAKYIRKLYREDKNTVRENQIKKLEIFHFFVTKPEQIAKSSLINLLPLKPG